MSENSSNSATEFKKVRNAVIAIVAIALSITLFLGLQSENVAYSLTNQAGEATPIEVAINNEKPTLLEFYADWCTSCQAMAEDLGKLKQQYGDSVNFVMLNVDNSKWLPEVLRYRVNGIPHFVFLNEEGNAIAQTIGEQPYSVMEANLAALIANSSLPYTRSVGQVSDFEANGNIGNSKVTPDDPRSHGSL